MIDKVALIYIKDRKVLSSKNKGKDVWYFPGGKREGNETDAETLIREIREELAVEILPETIRYFGTFEAQAHSKAAGVIVKMTCYFAEFEGEPMPSSELDDICWFGSEGASVSSAVDQIIYRELLEKNLID